jgi:hypothetical protein
VTGAELSPHEAESARRLAAGAGGELDIWDVTAEPAPVPLGEWAAELYGMPAKDALIAFDRDLMVKDGRSREAAEQMALQHAREQALNEVQADLEAG